LCISNVSCRIQVMVGELPADFLRVTSSAEQRQIAADRQTAAYLQSGGMMPVFAPASRLSITVAQVNTRYELLPVIFHLCHAVSSAGYAIICCLSDSVVCS